jgi:type I restriction enzyme, R subunit
LAIVEDWCQHLPELFKDEAELRTIWSQPEARAALVAGLAERGIDGEQLSQVRTMIDAVESDLFDVLNYIAHTKHPLKRAERADTHRDSILSGHDAKQQAFLDFVLAQYVAQAARTSRPQIWITNRRGPRTRQRGRDP